MAQVETAPSTDERPLPEPDATSRFHWEAATEGRLLIQACSACGHRQYPPEVCCVRCQSTDLDHVESAGRGTIYSHALVERPFHMGFLEAVPYVVVLVELNDQPGLRLVTNLVGVDPRTPLACGMRVEVAFEDRAGVALPQFRLAEEPS
jgi:uncharacterized OB-fold protein